MGPGGCWDRALKNYGVSILCMKIKGTFREKLS